MASRGHLTSRVGVLAVVSHHLELEKKTILRYSKFIPLAVICVL